MLIWCGVLTLGGNSLHLNGKEGAGNGLTNILVLNTDFYILLYCYQMSDIQLVAA